MAYHAGLLGRPYVWLGTPSWTFGLNGIQSLVSSEVNAAMSGIVTVESLYNTSDPKIVEFQSHYAKQYAVDPVSVGNVPKISPRSASSYDSVWFAARALEKLIDIRTGCGLNDDLSHFNLSDRPYQFFGDAAEPVGYTVDSLSFPAVCQHFQHFNGQGRVLNTILRTQVVEEGLTGRLQLQSNGDRISNIVIMNYYNGTLLPVGYFDMILTNKILSQFNLTQRDESDDAELTPEQGQRLVEWLLSADILFIGRPIRWPGGSTRIPADSVSTHYDLKDVTTHAKTAVIVLVAFTALYCIGLIAFNIHYRKLKVVKISSVNN